MSIFKISLHFRLAEQFDDFFDLVHGGGAWEDCSSEEQLAEDAADCPPVDGV